MNKPIAESVVSESQAMDQGSMTGAQVLVRMLLEYNVEVIFGVPGDTSLPLYDAIARGKRIYHGYAQCLNCHPAYATPAEITAASQELTGQAKKDFRYLRDDEIAAIHGYLVERAGRAGRRGKRRQHCGWASRSSLFCRSRTDRSRRPRT